MALRTRHGNAKRFGVGPVIETLPVDELPAGVPDASTPVGPARDKHGRYRAGHPATVEAARRAGHAKRHRTELAHTLAVRTDDPHWAALLRQAEAFRRAQVRLLAGSVGAGQCGPAPASLVSSAALALAGSRLAYGRGDLVQGARLAAESRQALLAAHELCAKEAMARPRGVNAFPWLQATQETSGSELAPPHTSEGDE